MPSSKDQFPDPWDPNAPDAVTPPPDEEGATEGTTPETDSGDDDFGLNELREMLGSEAEETQPADTELEELEGLFAPEASTDSSFDELFASLGLGSSVTSPNVEETQPSVPDILASLEEPAAEPNIDLFSTEQPDLNLSPESPESASIPNVESFAVKESNFDLPNFDLVSDPENLDLAADVNELESSSNLDAIASSELNLSAPDVPSEVSSFAPELEPNLSSESTEPDLAETNLTDVEAPEISGPELSDMEAALETEATPASLSSSNDSPAEFPLGAIQSETPNEFPDAVESLDVELPDTANVDTPEALTESSESESIPTIPEAESANVPTPVNIPVVPSGPTASDQSPDSIDDSNEPSPVGVGSTAENVSATTTSISATPSPASASNGSGSTYKQLLGGRQQIAAFSLILAGMGGIAGYGWTKAGIDNPLGTDFGKAPIGVIADRNDQEEEQTSPSNFLGIGGVGDEDLGLDPDNVSSAQDAEGTTDKQLGFGAAEQNSGVATSLTTGAALSTAQSGEAENQSTQALNSTESNTEAAQSQTPPPIDISDVPPEHWAHPYVVAMYEQGIVPDFPDGKFQPDKPVTRAELAASIQRAFKDKAGNEPIPFDDISNNYWAKDAITHAVNKGFMSGYSEDIFEPEQRIPRYQVLVSLVSGLGLQKIEDSTEAKAILNGFPDVGEMPAWALGQVAASQRADLIVGNPVNSGALEPNRPATRAEANAMIYQALVNAGLIEDTVQ